MSSLKYYYNDVEDKINALNINIVVAQTRFLFLQCFKMNLESSKVAAGPKKSHHVSDETKKLLQGKSNATVV